MKRSLYYQFGSRKVKGDNLLDYITPPTMLNKTFRETNFENSLAENATFNPLNVL